MSKDIKAGGAYVELAAKDEGFHEKFAKAKDRLLAFAAGAVSVGAVLKVAQVAFNAATAPLKEFVAAGSELDKMAKRTGATAEALSELQHAADKTGVSMSAVEGALKHLQSRRIDPTQFDAMAAAVAEIEDPVQRAQAAVRAFGDSGQELLPMLNNLEGMRNEARELGLVMDGESASAARRFGDTLRNLWEMFRAGLRAIGEVVAAIATPFTGPVQYAATFVLGAFRSMADGIHGVVASVQETVSATWQAIYDYMAPITGAIVAVSVEAFDALATAVAPVFEYIADVVSTVWGKVAEWTAQAMGLLQTGVLTALEAVSFSWQNWQTILQTALVSGELAVVRFANQVVYFFSDVMPTWLSWFGENWADVFTDIGNVTATIAGNIWENLKNLWDAIRGLFSGEGFQFEWTGLTEGFESAIKEWPKIAEREMGPLEASLQSELDGLATTLTTDWEKHGAQFAKSAEKFMPADLVGNFVRDANAKMAELSGAAGAATPSTKAMQSNVSGTFSAAAALAMGQGGNNDPTTKAIERSMRERKEQADKLLSAVKERKGLGP